MSDLKAFEKLKIFESFINSYLSRGVGGYSGRELEILVLDLLLKVRPDIESMSLFEKTKVLKATETKIKSLIYEIALRNEDENKTLIKQIEKNLESMFYEKGRVIIELDDIFSQRKIKSLLKENGFLTDSSFNSDLIKIPYEGFVIVVSGLYSHKSKKEGFKDFVATKKLASSNREVLKNIDFGFNVKSGGLWDVAVSMGQSLKAAIASYKESMKENKRDK